MNPRKYIAYTLVCGLLIASAVFMGACKQTGGKRHKLAFVTNNASDFWTISRKGTEKAAAELPDVEIDFRIDSDGTAAEQQRIVDDLLAKGVNGFAISPVDPVNQTQMLNRAAQQALVVTQDSDAPTATVPATSERITLTPDDKQASSSKSATEAER